MIVKHKDTNRNKLTNVLNIYSVILSIFRFCIQKYANKKPEYMHLVFQADNDSVITVLRLLNGNMRTLWLTE